MFSSKKSQPKAAAKAPAKQHEHQHPYQTDFSDELRVLEPSSYANQPHHSLSDVKIPQGEANLWAISAGITVGFVISLIIFALFRQFRDHDHKERKHHYGGGMMLLQSVILIFILWFVNSLIFNWFMPKGQKMFPNTRSLMDASGIVGGLFFYNAFQRWDMYRRTHKLAKKWEDRLEDEGESESYASSAL